MLSNFYLVLRIRQLMPVKFPCNNSNFIEKPRRVPIFFLWSTQIHAWRHSKQFCTNNGKFSVATYSKTKYLYIIHHKNYELLWHVQTHVKMTPRVSIHAVKDMLKRQYQQQTTNNKIKVLQDSTQSWSSS